MKKYSLFLFFGILCSALFLITIRYLFSQTARGMKTISVHTKTGKEIQLYKDSYALVIGNGNYTNDWDPLDGALTDVEEVETLLKKHGFHVTLKKDLTKAKFDRAFAEFVLKSGEDANSRLLFYYAGHGYTRKSATDEDLGYLVMVDAPAPETDKVGFELESVSMESLVTQTDKILARHVLFVFDSCFSGTVLNVRDRLTPPESISDRVQYPVRQFITAGRAGEAVPDHSDFKQAFLDLLDGRAREPFPDGYITGEELGFYLKNQVPVYNPAQHPQYGKIRNPKLDKGDFVFVLPKEEALPPPSPKERSTMATLTVTSTPNGADIYIDGGRIGKTPLVNHKINTGASRERQVEVSLELSGYQSRVVQLTLKGGQNTSWDKRLKKIRVSTEQILPLSSAEPIDLSGGIPEDMVLIPAGEFQMGSNAPEAENNERPVHTVYVNEFYMDVYEVTNAQYKEFVEANSHWAKNPRRARVRLPTGYKVRLPTGHHGNNYLKNWNENNYQFGKGNYPVTYVNWHAAMAYARWARKRLPTEAEWEKAARGGLSGKKYPWGDSIDSKKANYGSDITYMTAVGMYPPNPYGLYDMAGNVWEWCFDEYRSDFYKNSPSRNPVAGEGGIAYTINNFINTTNACVLRGGSWYGDPAEFLRAATRRGNAPEYTNLNVGFRCVKTIFP